MVEDAINIREEKETAAGGELGVSTGAERR
jgi:hypothetical protein